MDDGEGDPKVLGALALEFAARHARVLRAFDAALRTAVGESGDLAAAVRLQSEMAQTASARMLPEAVAQLGAEVQASVSWQVTEAFKHIERMKMPGLGLASLEDSISGSVATLARLSEGFSVPGAATFPTKELLASFSEASRAVAICSESLSPLLDLGQQVAEAARQMAEAHGRNLEQVTAMGRSFDLLRDRLVEMAEAETSEEQEDAAESVFAALADWVRRVPPTLSSPPGFWLLVYLIMQYAVNVAADVVLRDLS